MDSKDDVVYSALQIEDSARTRTNIDPTEKIGRFKQGQFKFIVTACLWLLLIVILMVKVSDDNGSAGDDVSQAKIPSGVLYNTKLEVISKQIKGCWKLCYRAPFGDSSLTRDLILESCGGDWLFIGALSTNSYSPEDEVKLGAFARKETVLSAATNVTSLTVVSTMPHLEVQGIFDNGLYWYPLYLRRHESLNFTAVSIGFASEGKVTRTAATSSGSNGGLMNAIGTDALGTGCESRLTFSVTGSTSESTGSAACIEFFAASRASVNSYYSQMGLEYHKVIATNTCPIS